VPGARTAGPTQPSEGQAAGLPPVNPGAPPDLVELGVLRGSYGLQGWSHVQPHAADPGVLREVRQWWLLPPGEGNTAVHGPLRVTGARMQGSAVVARWQGCDSPEAAQALRGWRVAVSRAQFPPLPEGQFYWVDLVGLQVVNRQGAVLGVVRALRSTGAHDVLEVQADARQYAPAGDTGAAAALLIPLVDAYVEGVDLQARSIRVDWQADW